jgi:hypothetical protein
MPKRLLNASITLRVKKSAKFACGSAKACRKSHQNRTAERFETAKAIQLCTRYGLRSGLPDLIAEIKTIESS